MRKAEKVILIFFIFTSLALGYIIFKPEKQVQTPDYSERIDLSFLKSAKTQFVVEKKYV